MTFVPQHWDASKLISHFKEVGKTGRINSVLTDDLIGAVVQSAFNETKDQYFEINESVTVYYGETLTVGFRAGGPRLSIRELRVNVSSVEYKNEKYRIFDNFIEISGKCFEIFYNIDHAILYRIIDTYYVNFLSRNNITAPPLRSSWSKENRSEVEINLGLEREVGERIAAHAASLGLDVEEWIRDAINRRLKALPEAAAIAKIERPPNGELYEFRTNKTEKAPEFIGRVYKEWLTGDFTRSDLRKIDEKAEMALRNWERNNGRANLNLPTIKERNDKLVAEGRLLSDDPKETRRRMAAAANRATLDIK